jgi:hypothetical protein
MRRLKGNTLTRGTYPGGYKYGDLTLEVGIKLWSGNNWTTLFLRYINTVTWSSILGGVSNETLK